MSADGSGFGGAAPNELPVSEQLRTMCPECSRHFPAEARFCTFDGSLLLLTSMRSQDDPLVGEVIDARYQVLHVLGEGGMGIVYHVRHAALEREFGLKVLRKDLAKDTNLCTRFIREARAAAAVDHPGIVQIKDFGALPSGQPYFVMELLAGQSLTQLLTEHGALPLPRFVNIVEQLVEALEAAHAVGVVHRDLKPDNVQILTDSSGADLVKILDFGLARVGGESRITKQGFVFGTPHYMSPEQAQGDSVDHRADIYALGVLMYEMITGKLPFDADSYMGVLTQHIHAAPERPSKVLGTTSLGELEELILCCMEKRPERRFESLAALRKAWGLALREGPAGIQVVPRRFWGSSLASRGRSERQTRLGAGWRWARDTGWLWPLLIGPPVVALGASMLWVKLEARRPAAPSQERAGAVFHIAESLAEVPEVHRQAAGPQARESAPQSPGSMGVPSAAPPGRPDARAPKIQSATSLPAKSRSRPPTVARAAPDAAPTALPPTEAPQPLPTSQIVDPWAGSE